MQSNSANQARWIAFALWGGLLVVLLLSSITITDFASRNNWIISAGWVSYFPESASQSLVIPHHNQSIAVLAQVTMAIFVAFCVVRAWLRFGQMTLQLLIAYSKADSEDSQRTIVAHFLTLTRITDGIPSSYLTDCVRSLALAWGVIIIWPTVLALAWIVIQ